MEIYNIMNEKYKNYLYGIITFLSVGFLELFYFRDIFTKNLIPGEGADCRLIGMILEHWFDVLCGKERILTLRFFWPYTNTLGYSDALWGPGLIYSCFRMIGLKPFDAMPPALMTLHVLGVVFFYLSLRKLRISRKLSVLGLLLSFWSCSYTQLIWHGQFFSLAFLSVFFYGILCIFSHRHESWKKRLPSAILITVSIGFCYLSAFYIAYLFTFYTLLVIFLYFCFLLLRDRTHLRELLHTASLHIRELLFYVFLQLSWLIPLGIIYFPVYRAAVPDPALARGLAPEPWDLFRTFSFAPLEMFVNAILPFTTDQTTPGLEINRLFETSYGYPVIVVVLLLISTIDLLRHKKQFLFCMYAAFWLLFLLGCRYGSFYPWMYLKYLVPGSSAIRATGRILGILTPAVALLLCLWLSDLSLRIQTKNSLYSAISFLLLFGALTLTGQCRRIYNDTSAELHTMTDHISAPPSDCKAMILADPLLTSDPYVAQMNACIIADHFDIYTLNGYSGNFPPEWDLLEGDLNNYFVMANHWLSVNGITDVSHIYIYYAPEDQWIPYPDYR